MSATPPEEIKEIRKHVKLYIGVFVALLILTVLTVAVSYLRLFVPLAIAVALIIAVTKGSLVANFFMHLTAEKKLIYWTLLATVVFLLMLIFLPLLGVGDQVGRSIQ